MTQKEKETFLKYYVREIVAGSIGGASGVLVGHPLDLVKVIQQNGSQKVRASVILLQLLSKSPWGLTKGVVPPLVNGVVYQSLMFPGYRLGLSLQEKPKGRKETILESSIAGLFGGLLSTLGTTPLEVAKIKLQLDPGAQAGTKGATTRQLLHLLKSRQLYSGWTALAIRDGPGTAVYMASYCELKNFGLLYSLPREVVELISGGLAGVLCWLTILPFDTVKTRLQYDAGLPIPKYGYRGVVHGISQIVKTEGVKALFSGWGPLCARAFPVNAVTFFVYEQAIRRMKI
jgi:solute carrier family 25 carnitine/acylcarnitine transporter 20/29